MKIKLIIPAILLFVITKAYSQSPAFPIDAETKKISYSEVIELGKTVKKATIQTRAKTWVGEKKFLAKNKQVASEYAFKGNILINYPGATTGKNERGSVEFIGTLYLKDGRYKYVISNLKHVGEEGRGSGGALENETPECGKFVLPLSSWAKIKNEVYAQMPGVISSMKQSLAGTKVVAKKKNPGDF